MENDRCVNSIRADTEWKIKIIGVIIGKEHLRCGEYGKWLWKIEMLAGVWSWGFICCCPSRRLITFRMKIVITTTEMPPQVF